jgi:hypothetical protein
MSDKIIALKAALNFIEVALHSAKLHDDIFTQVAIDYAIECLKTAKK